MASKRSRVKKITGTLVRTTGGFFTTTKFQTHMALSTHEFQWIHSHPTPMISLQKDFFHFPKLQISFEGHHSFIHSFIY
jgi:hypothetical protein